ncbi:hypothetical protein TDB9533_01430 [Thalassocella blandensis]|nr:hypothetical protein TDB9533_01430 [Thalassocella blandensis]
MGKLIRWLGWCGISLALGCGSGLGQEPPLHQAAISGDTEEIYRLLTDGVAVDNRNREGATALHWAAFKGREDAAKALLRAGADVNARTKKGSTPLRLATTHKQEELIQLLQMYGGEI